MQVSVDVAGVYEVTCYAVFMTTPPYLTSFPDQQRNKPCNFSRILHVIVPNLKKLGLSLSLDKPAHFGLLIGIKWSSNDEQ